MSRLSTYELGATALFACQADKRFSYCLYVPSDYRESAATGWALAVVVHGSGRDAPRYRAEFADFAEASRCIVLAPLFPCGITDPKDMGSYKFLHWGGVKYDEVLLSMIDEVSYKYTLHTEKFLLFGFSGGGQFAHRFFYAHSDRLSALSVGAPGVVTLLDFSKPWWCGVRDAERVFTKGIDLESMRQVPVQMLIGACDTETWEMTLTPDSRYWMEGINDAGTNRIDRIRALKNSFENHGISVQFDQVPGIGHNGYALLEPVKAFFKECLVHLRQAGELQNGEPQRN